MCEQLFALLAPPPTEYHHWVDFDEFCIYRSLENRLTKKIFKKFFVSINVEGQKFLPEVEGHFFEFVVFCCSNKKNLQKFF